MSTPPSPSSADRGAEEPQNIATAIAEVTERATLLVREEIELAKAEVTEKVGKLVKGAVVAVAAGVFVLVALAVALEGLAWLIWWALGTDQPNYFWGFFILAGLIAAKAVKAGSPPVPKMAIDEARKIRETVNPAPAGTGTSAATAPAPSSAPPQSPRPAHTPSTPPPAPSRSAPPPHTPNVPPPAPPAPEPPQGATAPPVAPPQPSFAPPPLPPPSPLPPPARPAGADHGPDVSEEGTH